MSVASGERLLLPTIVCGTLIGVDQIVEPVDAEHRRIGEQRIGPPVVVRHHQIDGVEREGRAADDECGDQIDRELAHHRRGVVDVRSAKMNLALVVSNGLVSVKPELVIGIAACPWPSSEPVVTVL